MSEAKGWRISLWGKEWLLYKTDSAGPVATIYKQPDADTILTALNSLDQHAWPFPEPESKWTKSQWRQLAILARTSIDKLAGERIALQAENAALREALAEVVELLTHRCAACKAGYPRTGSETQNHWKTTKHYITEAQAEALGVSGHYMYFLDGGYVYCNADLQEWLAKWAAALKAASPGESTSAEASS